MKTARPKTSTHLERHKRGSSPPSLAEAAEIASQHRRSKKPRSSLRDSDISEFPSPQLMQATDDSGPATPETETGSLPVFKAPVGGSRLKRPSLRTHSKNASASSLEHEPRLPNTLTRSSLSRHVATSRSTSASTISGVAATPPIVEGDLERIAPFDDNEEDRAQQRLPALDILSAQDAPLPSPSLSPITAAANLASQLPSTQEQEEDENEVSSLDISQDALDNNTPNSLHKRRASVELQKLEMPPPLPAGGSNPQLPTPTFMDMPVMLDSFDALPAEMQRWVMYQMLRRCSKNTLHFVADVVNPALKCDFLTALPLELSLQITKYLDAKSMCRAAQVSKRWRQIVDSDEAAWKNLLVQDGFALAYGELERAIREGWGWQFPYGLDSGEEDLSYTTTGSDWSLMATSPRSAASFQPDSDIVMSTSGRPKRKATSRNGPSSKRQKRKAPSSAGRQYVTLSTDIFDDAQGPIAHASAAATAVPNAAIGLPSLRNLHLYKSLYRRHFLIGRSWMEDEMKPRHIAFRAHQRHVVTCLQFDADKILTGSDDTKINVYDTKTGAKRKTLEGHDGGVWALEYDGNTLVSGSTDRSVRVWDIETGKCLQIFQGHTSTVRCLVILKPTQVDTHDDGTPIMFPPQPYIITGSRDSSLRVWKLPKPGDQGVFHAGPPPNDADNPYFLRALTGHHHSVRAIAAHGDTLVSGSYDCTVRVWKISTGEMQHRLTGHTQKVYSVVLDHARKRCVSGSMDNLVKVWSLDQGICLFNLEGHTSLVGLLDLSHERLVSAAADSTLRIWDPNNGEMKAKLVAHTGAITCFQHDDQKVISGSDKLLKMWNIKTGKCTKDLLTDLSGVWQVKFNDRQCVAAVQRKNLTYIEVRRHTSGEVLYELTSDRSLTLAHRETASPGKSAELASSLTGVATKLPPRSLRTPTIALPTESNDNNHQLISTTLIRLIGFVLL